MFFQESLSVMRSLYIRNSEGFVLVYSATSRSSMEELIEIHEQIARVKDSDNFPAILVANKCDLADSREVSRSEGEALAKSLGCKYIEASAKTRENIDNIFYDLVLAILASEKPISEKKSKRKVKELCTLL
jgi:GTPase KRas